MRCLLFIALIAICLSSVSQNDQARLNDCEKAYDNCILSTTGNNVESVSGWLSSGYAKLLGRDVCLDIFQGCKNLQKKKSDN